MKQWLKEYSQDVWGVLLTYNMNFLQLLTNTVWLSPQWAELTISTVNKIKSKTKTADAKNIEKVTFNESHSQSWDSVSSRLSERRNSNKFELCTFIKAEFCPYSVSISSLCEGSNSQHTQLQVWFTSCFLTSVALLISSSQGYCGRRALSTAPLWQEVARLQLMLQSRWGVG